MRVFRSQSLESKNVLAVTYAIVSSCPSFLKSDIIWHELSLPPEWLTVTVSAHLGFDV